MHGSSLSSVYINVHPKSEDSLVQGPTHVGADYTWKESGSNTVHGSITRCSAVLILELQMWLNIVVQSQVAIRCMDLSLGAVLC